MLRISKANQITSIADLIGARFGRSARPRGARHHHRGDRPHPLYRAAAQIDPQGFAALTRQLARPGRASRCCSMARSGPPPSSRSSPCCSAAARSIPASITPAWSSPSPPNRSSSSSSLTIIGLFVVYGLFHGFGDLFTKAAAVAGRRADLRLLAQSLRLQLDRHDLPRDAGDLLPAAAVPGHGGRERRRAPSRSSALAVPALSPRHQSLRSAHRARRPHPLARHRQSRQSRAGVAAARQPAHSRA